MHILIEKGIASQKTIRGEEKQVTPFVGADGEGSFSQLGVGVLVKDVADETTSLMWGLLLPHNLIQSWRAMKLVEGVPELAGDTLCQSWYSAQKQCHPSDVYHQFDLAERFSDQKSFDAIRDVVLKAVPNEEELSSMLSAVRDKNLYLSDLTEINQIINEGEYPESKKILEEIAKRQNQMMTEWKKDEPVKSALEVQPDIPNKQNFFSRILRFKRHEC